MVARRCGGLRVVGFVGCCLGVGRDWRIGGEEMRRGEFARVELCVGAACVFRW